MQQNKNRIGNFTSSEIANLMTTDKSGKNFGKPALTYIEEKRMERRLGRSLNTEISSRPTSWGNLVESYAFNLLGRDENGNISLKYIPTSKKTILHPEIDYWSGSPDGIYEDENGKTVYDLKSPVTLKSFCQLADSKSYQELIDNHKEGETYFWQLVSNAILTNARFAELIIYLPYKKDLEAIRELASNFDGNQNKIAWIGFSEDEDLPYLIEGNYYKHLYIIRFEVTNLMKQQLTSKVIEAGKILLS